MSDSEVVRLAESEAVAGLCPVTEANLGDGLFRAGEFLGSSGRYAIGTDSNVHIDAAEELRNLEYAQRLNRRERNLWISIPGASSGRALFDGALAGGAQSLGTTSGICVGARADFVSLDADDPTIAGRSGDDLLDSWIFAGARIDCVWRNGQRVVSSGAHNARTIVEGRCRGVLRRLLSDE
jgi:cytosine/adenosine deaminase-related metal-dependent hydrolase